MIKDSDISRHIVDSVKQAMLNNSKLRIAAGESKSFYGNSQPAGIEVSPLSIREHTGILAYEPSELFITVRAGTRLKEINSVLSERNQMLPFEPPGFSDTATIGGVIACGFSGPARPFYGSARDAILGCRIVNGRGEVLSFGGQVMKNVAGYDVTRLMVGAMGTLGVLLELTLKVLPKPEVELTIVQSLGAQEALDLMNTNAATPLPLTAAGYDGDAVMLRLSGSEMAVTAGCKKITGDELGAGANYWESIKEQTHLFFQNDLPLWRLSLAPGRLPLDLPGQWLFEWGGALRWLASDAPIKDIRDAVAEQGGHAILFKGKELYQNHSDETLDVFHPLPEPLSVIHKNLKIAFDPQALFNPGRFHADLD